jgi:hypothetical protein
VTGPTLRSPRERADVLRSFVWSLPGAAWLVCLFAVGAPTHLRPGLDPDASWRLRLSLARGDGSRFGPDVVYTYGPWGYLDDPTAASRVGVALGLLFAVAAVSLAWWACWGLLRPSLGPSPAAVVTTACIVVLAAPLGASNLLLAGAVIVLARYVADDTWSHRSWVVPAAAAAGAFLLQVKLSVGVCLLGLAFVGWALGPHRNARGAVNAALAAGGTFLGAWVLAGQDPRDLPLWLSRSAAVVGGYSEAMGTDPASPWTSYGWAVASVALIGAALWRDSRGGERRARAGLFALAALSAYYGYRQGFGRFDAYHEPVFYLGIFPFAVRAVARRPRAVVRWGVLALVLVLGRSGTDALSPDRAADRWASATRVVVDAGYRERMVESARAAALAESGLSPAMRAALQGHSVSVDGYSTGLAWMAGVPLAAPPAFQSFVAYTAELDELNARWLRDRPAGHLVLRPASTAIDGRNSLWDPPRYVLEELCRTRVDSADPRWMLLAPSADRCGAPEDLGAVEVKAGETVTIPSAPGAIVVMSFQPSDPGPVGLLAALFAANSTPLHATVDGRRFRLPRALASGPLIASVPPAVGWPQSHGGGTRYRMVVFDRGGTVRFRAIPVRAGEPVRAARS